MRCKICFACLLVLMVFVPLVFGQKVFQKEVWQSVPLSVEPKQAAKVGVIRARWQVYAQAAKWLGTMPQVMQANLTKGQLTALAAGVVKTSVPVFSSHGTGKIKGYKIIVKGQVEGVTEKIKRMVGNPLYLEVLDVFHRRTQKFLYRYFTLLKKTASGVPQGRMFARIQANLKKNIKKLASQEWLIRAMGEGAPAGENVSSGRALAKSLLLDNANPAAHYLLGRAHDRKGRKQKAIESYSTAIKSKRDFFPAYYWRGLLLFKKGDFKQAASDLSRVIRTRKATLTAFEKRGESYFQLKKYKQAARDFSTIIRYRKEHTDGYWKRAKVYEAMEKPYLAGRDYRKILSLEPENPRAYFRRGVTEFNRNRMTNAIRLFNQALEKKPRYPQALYQRGLSYLGRKKKPEACLDIQKACRLKFKLACTTRKKIGC